MNPPAGTPRSTQSPLPKAAVPAATAPRGADRLAFYRMLAGIPALSTFGAKVNAVVLFGAFLPAFLLILAIVLGAGRISALALIALVVLCAVAGALSTLWALGKLLVALDLAAESIDDVALGHTLDRVELPGSDTVAQILRGVQALVARVEAQGAEAIARRDIDELTALLNRRAGRERAQALIDRETSRGRAVRAVIVDVNRFTAFNARHGSGHGDALLKRIGARVARVAGEDGIAARWHGDTFLLVQAVTPEDDFAMESQLGRPIVVKGVEDPMSLAFGSALSEQRVLIDALVTEAEAALARARTASR